MSDECIHLCQPDDYKSCGACCGLYNYADSTKESLTRRLRRRREWFLEMVKAPEDVEMYSRRVTTSEDPAKLYEVIHCCEFLGFLDDEERRVGCLLHPLQRGGVDLREFSFYGRELCAGHLCPSYHFISRDEQKVLISIINDWYLYGLCVTDIDFVKAYFRMFSDAVGEMPPPWKWNNGPLREAALKFFSLKISWPFRSTSTRRFGKYYFDGSQYMISSIDYESLGCERSRYDTVFVSLASEFSSASEVKEAERLIRCCIDECVAAYEGMQEEGVSYEKKCSHFAG